MQIVDNAALKLKLKDASKVRALIPKSATLRATPKYDEVLVNWGLEEAQLLKNLGIKNVPSPIVGRYKWPGMYSPLDHQKITASFLTLYRRAYCFNDMGTMKTATVAWATDYLMRLGYIKRVLIICPISTMSTAWKDDLFKTAMHRRVDIAYGTREKRIRVINSDAEYIIINTDGVGVVTQALRKGNFDMVVIDEATSIKTATTDRWKAINSLIRPDTWLWMLTGSPSAQTPMDAYGLAKMMNPSAAPRTEALWRDEVMVKVAKFKWVPRMGWQQIVYDLLQPAIRFTKAECLDLPEILYVRRDVELSGSQRAAYEAVRKSLAMQAAGEVVTAVNAASGLSKLLQVSCGSVYTDAGNTLEFDIKPRYKELCSILDEAKNKVLVFVPFTNTIDRLVEKLTTDGYAVAMIDGRVSANKRTKIINDFQQQPEPKVLILQPQAVSHGITLHAADTSVWWGPIMSYETWIQANSRMHRGGQKNNCLVVSLQGSPVERIRYRALIEKDVDQQDLLSMYKEVLNG